MAAAARAWSPPNAASQGAGVGSSQSTKSAIAHAGQGHACGPVYADELSDGCFGLPICLGG